MMPTSPMTTMKAKAMTILSFAMRFTKRRAGDCAVRAAQQARSWATSSSRAAILSKAPRDRSIFSVRRPCESGRVRVG
jgi:hypothetical protein